MNAPMAVFGCLIAAYLVGSIPFGLTVARRFGGVDIRTVGSGNIGATNVGRVLGFRFFLAVFLLDYLKGLLPTLSFPILATRATGFPLPHLAVGVAVAAIVGHNFPIYLKFQGGKGVATSLGAVTALDPIAGAAAASAFALTLVTTRYVSVSSIVGGLAWLGAHFARVDHPTGRDQVALTVASIGLMGLLIARHRQNFARLVAGTEPKVNLGRRKREGKAAAWLVVALASLAGAGALALNSGRKAEVVFGPYHASEVDRVATGHQRAERLVFLDGGELLAATCPRYDRMMLYRVTDGLKLELVRDISLGGRPVALAASGDRVYALSRPSNDARHVEEGFWEGFDLEGRPIGGKVRVGMYPDDLAITPDGRFALILTSGRAEGGPHRPLPGLTIRDLTDPSRIVGRLEFNTPGDDPARLALSDDGKIAAVSLQGSNAIAWIDSTDPTNPQFVARRSWPEGSVPDALRFDHRGGLLAVDEGGEALRFQAGPQAEPTVRPVDGGVGDAVEIPGSPDSWACTVPFDSSVAFLPASASPDRPLDRRLPLRGRANLSATRPMGLAFEPNRRLIAVANRSGGSIHLVAIQCFKN